MELELSSASMLILQLHRRVSYKQVMSYRVIVMRCPRSVLARLVTFWMGITGEVTENFLQLFSKFLLVLKRLYLLVLTSWLDHSNKSAGPL